MKMVERKTWEEFKKIGLLWWVNRTLHLFGWSIVVVEENNGKISDIYPARVKFRGFDERTETNSFVNLTRYLKKTVKDLEKETRL